MENHKRRVRLTFVSPVLGTASNDKNLHETYISSKAPDAKTTAEEVAMVGVEEAVEKGMTVFYRDEDGRPVMRPYQIAGYFKEACGFLRKVKGTKASGIKAYKSELNGLVFINPLPSPQNIVLNLPGEMGDNQRPLRISDQAGQRTAIAHSEEAPAGTTMEFEIMCLTKTMHDLIPELLDYGILHGMCQWRNAGYGRFTWEET